MIRLMNSVSILFSCLFLLVGCGPSIWSVSNRNELPANFDGALLSYAFASGVVQFSAAYSAKQLTLTSDQTVKAVPDYDHQHVLAYNHQTLSSDDVTIELEGALLKQVSSTTEDKSVAAVQAVNALLTQVSATQKALEKATVKTLAEPAEKAPLACSDMKVSRVANITYQRPEKEVTQQASVAGSDCELHIELVVSPPTHTLGIKGFPRDDLDRPNERQCDFAVCFRLAGTYHVTATAKLSQQKKLLDSTTMEFDVLAPRPDMIGFVRFNRRAFVQNTTSIQWTNGVVSKFTAKNPSEVVGFFALPTALLTTVAVTAALVK